MGHYCSLFTHLVIFVIYYPCLLLSPLLSIIVYIVVYHCLHCYLSLFSLLINIPAYGLDSLDLCAPAQGCLLSLIVSIVESKLFSLLINIPAYGLDSLDLCAPAHGCLLLSLSSLFTPSLPVCSVTFPTHTRYIPDTYPIHMYIPRISY